MNLEPHSSNRHTPVILLLPPSHKLKEVKFPHNAQPPSVTQGIEGESNIYLSHGLSMYLNASYDSARYVDSAAYYCNPSAANCNSSVAPITISTPSGLWVSNTPSEIEAEGLTYQHKGSARSASC